MTIKQVGRVASVEVEILPCPHCGATPERVDDNTGMGVRVYMNAPSSDEQPWPHVACLECGSGSPSIEAWNQRVDDCRILDKHGMNIGDKAVVNGNVWRVVGAYNREIVVADQNGDLLRMLPRAWKWWKRRQPEKKTKSRKEKST